MGVNHTGSGVWYRVEGTGDSITAQVCSDDGLDLSLSIFSGTSCNDLSCVAAGSDYKGCTFASWDSVQDEDYYIYVSAAIVGGFSLIVEESTNDFCAGATPVYLDAEDPLVASLDVATPDAITNQKEFRCGIQSWGQYPGVWFSYKSNVTGLVVGSTCHPGNGFRTLMIVYKGTSCDELSCVGSSGRGGNSNECSLRAEYQFFAQQNVVYRFLVSGVSPPENNSQLRFSLRNFDLNVAPQNDNCNTAIPIPISSSSSLDTNTPILGTTIGLSIENFDSLLLQGNSCSDGVLEALYESGPGVWYSYESTSANQTLTISACQNSDYIVELTVFVGGGGGGGGGSESVCDESLSCVTPLTINDCSVTWTAENQGQIYYILVHSFQNPIVGNFEIILQEQHDYPIVNENCEYAIPIDIGDVISGSTIGVSKESFDLTNGCIEDAFTSFYGVWYKYEPTTTTTEMVSITSCSKDGITNYGGSQLQVLKKKSGDTTSSSSCDIDTLECLEENVDFKYCNDSTVGIIPGMTITWEALKGSIYYIFVAGDSRNVGFYEISLTTAAAV